MPPDGEGGAGAELGDRDVQAFEGGARVGVELANRHMRDNEQQRPS